MTLLSAVLPVWNIAEFVGETMQTLLSQTLRDFELIVVDDGSTDDTVAVIEAFCDPRVRIIRTPHRGLAAAENTGLAAATSPYMIRVDGDDLYDPSLFEKLVAKAQAHPSAAVVGCWVRRFGRAQWAARPPDDPVAVRRMLRRTWVLSQPVLYRVDAVRAVGGFRDVHSEDWDLWIRLAAHHEIRVVTEMLALIRARPTSMTATQSPLADALDMLRLRTSGVRRLGADLRVLLRLVTGFMLIASHPVLRFVPTRTRLLSWIAPHRLSATQIRWERPSVSVVVPTVDRVGLLARCLAALEVQTCAPHEVVVVHRDDHEPTARFLQAWCAADPRRRRAVTVAVPGIVHALATGTDAASGEVVAYLDDDAVPRPTWLEEIARGFFDPRVGAVGGPIVDHVAGVPIDGHAQVVGRITWYGRIVWGHDKRTDHYGAVDWLTGSNMAFRRELAVHDRRLRHSRNGLALANDLDACLTVRRAGKRVLYTPWAVVEHHTTSFRDPVLGSRVAGEDIVASSANHAYALLKFVPRWRRIFLHAFGYLAGSASIPGPVRVLIEVPRSRARARELAGRVGPTWRGRRLGARMYREWLAETRGRR